MPEHDSHDKLTLTLDTLRSDVERTPLADSMTVRRRGDQRTRRQAVGGALAVVALVAGTAGILGGAGGFRQADAPPATQGPTASTDVEQRLALAVEPLIQPSDIGAIGPYTDWQLSPDAEQVDQPFNLCVPSPTTLAPAISRYGHFYTDLDAGATEHALQFADTASARAAGDQLLAALADCDLGAASDNIVTTPAKHVRVSDADDAQVAAREASPPDSEVSYYELAVVQKANVVVVLQWSSMGLPDGVTQVWTTDRLTTALRTAVG
jgi:hypothetical protein